MLQITLYQAVALEGKKIHWCYFGLYSELCGGVTGEMIMDNDVNNVTFMGKLNNISKDL